MKQIFYLVLISFFFSCYDLGDDISVEYDPACSSSSINPAFSSELIWRKAFPEHYRLFAFHNYHDYKLYDSGDDYIVLIPTTQVQSDLKIMVFHKSTGHKLEFTELSSSFGNHKLYNDNGFIRNPNSDEVLFNWFDSVLALNLKTMTLRELSNDRYVKDYSSWGELYTEGRSDQTHSLFSYEQGETKKILEFLNDDIYQTTVERAIRINEEQIAVKLRSTISLDPIDESIVIYDLDGNVMFQIQGVNSGQFVPHVFNDQYLLYLESKRLIKIDITSGEVVYNWDFSEHSYVRKIIVEGDCLYTRSDHFQTDYETIRKFKVLENSMVFERREADLHDFEVYGDELVISKAEQFFVLNKEGETTYSEVSPILWCGELDDFHNRAPLLIGNNIYNGESFGLHKTMR